MTFTMCQKKGGLCMKENDIMEKVKKSDEIPMTDDARRYIETHTTLLHQHMF